MIDIHVTLRPIDIALQPIDLPLKPIDSALRHFALAAINIYIARRVLL